jgi:hypothetical protein
MQTVSSIYLEGMGEMVRKPSRMRLTFHYPTGDIVYTNADIVKVTEKKTAHLIAGELPAIELEMELVNLDGSFNPNDISGLHDLIIKGVLVNYEFGYDVPNLQYYGYTDGEEHDYGMEENVPYGFMEGYATEWIPGGEVFTSGEISYSKTTATISAKDYLSFLDEHILYAYGNRTLAQVAKDVLSLTDYPKEEDGDPKIITGPELDAFNTAITLSETEDESISAKEHLQTIAHACGVQMYIDRGGYIHLDNDKRGVSAVYSLPLSQQGEEPEHRKEQMPKKMVIVLNSEYGDPVEVDLNGGGETMTVENPFIVTTAEGETLSGVVYDHFIKYRNTADIPYRGEPAIDILDTITLGTEFGGDVEAIVVGTELEFDGTLSGSLSVRYQLGGNTPEKVQIKGSGNFIYPLGVDDEPSITSFDLVCETTFPTPTYQWSYFTVSNGAWMNIVGATSNTLTVAYNSSYYNNDSSVKFRCVVNGVKGAITQISKIKLQKSETSGYRGTVVATTPANIDVPSPVVGDVVLMDNTSDGTATVYGEAHVYNGEAWVPTEESDALAMTYKDALQLAKDSGKTIYASEIYANLIVTKNLIVGEGNGTAGSGFRFRAINDKDMDLSNVPVFDVYKDDKQLFKVDIDTGNIYFGEHFWYSPIDGAIHTPGDNTKITADGFAYLLGILRTGANARSDARVAIQDEAGITSGPTFTGSGANDLSIVNEGAVAGNFEVKITGVGNGNLLSITLSILSSFSSPAGTPTGLAFDGTNLISCDLNAHRIYVHNGVSSSILYSFESPAGASRGLTFDGTNLISCDANTRMIYIHNGVSSSILSSFPSPGTAPRGLTFDGTNLISCDSDSYTTHRIYVHNGVSSSILYSFESPADIPSGLAFDGTNLISCDLNAYRIYVHNGVSSSILSSFANPARPSGLTFDGTNLISCDYDADKIYTHKLVYTYSDKFTWAVGAYTSAQIPMTTGGTYNLNNGTDYGITISFGKAYGHTLNDKWTFVQGAMRGLSIIDSSGDEYFSASSGNVYADNLDVSGDITLGTPSLSSTGYSLLPNGLLLQWGSFSSTTDGDQTVYFPVAFTTGYQTVVDGWITARTVTYNDRFVFNRYDSAGNSTRNYIAIGLA